MVPIRGSACERIISRRGIVTGGDFPSTCLAPDWDLLEGAMAFRASCTSCSSTLTQPEQLLSSRSKGVAYARCGRAQVPREDDPWTFPVRRIVRTKARELGTFTSIPILAVTSHPLCPFEAFRVAVKTLSQAHHDLFSPTKIPLTIGPGCPYQPISSSGLLDSTQYLAGTLSCTTGLVNISI